DLADRSADLYRRQRELASELQRAVRDALDDRIERGIRGGIDRQTALDIGERKEALRRELEALEQDIQRIAQQFQGQTPGASETLTSALTQLQQSQATARLSIASEMIRQGYGVEAAATDAVTTSVLRDLEQRTREALDRASEEALAGGRRDEDPSAELLAELRALRRELDDLMRGPGDPLDPRSGQPGARFGAEQLTRRGEGQPGEEDPSGP